MKPTSRVTCRVSSLSPQRRDADPGVCQSRHDHQPGHLHFLANYFADSGSILANPGKIDISVGPATITNGTFIATNGAITIGADCLLITATCVIYADRTLTLTAPSSLGDGYVVFGNHVGHATNATLPSVVTNGNTMTVGGGVRITAKPATADLPGNDDHQYFWRRIWFRTLQWAGEDRGATLRQDFRG